MHPGGTRVTGENGPEYQRVMREIRSRIISGDYPVDAKIPSTTELVRQTGMSQPVVRRAVDQLKAEGVLEGHQGKGVFVKAVPADADSARMTAEMLGVQVGDLIEQYDDLRLRVAHLETELMDLKAGHGLPQGGEHDQENQPARRRPAR